MKYSLTFLEEDYERLFTSVFLKQGCEGAAYLLCGTSRSDQETRLLVRQVIPVKEEHYLVRTSHHLSIPSDSFVPVAKKALESKSSIVFVHSHPEGINFFSEQDDKEDPKLCDFFARRVPNGVHASLVISGPESLCGRIWNDGKWAQLNRIRVVGRRFRFFDFVGDPDEIIPPFFDRQVRAFNSDIQRLLKRLHIGVVGVGGTGSAIVEQLTRLGVGQISLFDHDVFDVSNVNRVYGSGIGDKGKLKVDISETNIHRIGVGTEIRKYGVGINFESGAQALRDCDVVFGCTDKHAPRGVLTQLSIRYLIPIFDVGVRIETDGSNHCASNSVLGQKVMKIG